ncbi:MAG: aminopeptidase [Pseudomonadota bacterium]
MRRRGPGAAGAVWWLAGAVAVLLPLTGCEVPYLLRQGQGQLDLLLHTRPLTELVNDKQEDGGGWRWALAWSAREFARERLQLTVTDQYERGIEIEGEGVAWVVSAAGRFDLAPYTWQFPVLGGVPYKGYFDRADAEAEASRLQGEGLDVLVRPVTAYSLLGVLPDPLLSTMVQGSPERIVEVVIHELAHATVYAAGQGEFNEGLATFIGRQGRQAFIVDKLGPDSLALTQAVQRDADADRYREAVLALSQDLASLYASGRATVAGKQRIFRRHQRAHDEIAASYSTAAYRAARLPDNNAGVAAMRVYTFNAQLYAKAFAAVGEDWAAFIDLLKQVSPSDSALAHLEHAVRDRVAQRQGSLRAAPATP